MKKKVLPLLLVIGFFVLMFFVVKSNRTNIQDNEVESENRKKSESVFENDKDSALTKINENKALAAVQKKSIKVNQVSDDRTKARSVVNKSVKEEKQSRFYGKARVGIGYEYQRYAGSDMGDLKNEARIKINNPDFNNVKKFNQAPVVSLGYNLYYKLNDRFSLLGGLETQLRYPVGGSNLVYTSSIVYDAKVKFVVKFEEYFRLNTKFGVKTNLNKKLDVETYGIIGMNVASFKSKYYFFDEARQHIFKTNVGFTTGLGADLVIDNKFIVGLEYRYGLNKFNKGDLDFKMKTHSVLAKVGYQF